MTDQVDALFLVKYNIHLKVIDIVSSNYGFRFKIFILFG